MPAAEGTDEEKKSRHTTDELRELAKSVRSGQFQYDGRPKRSLDWSSYNEAQVNEMADTLNLIRRFVDRASARTPERPRRRGRPPFPARDVAKALLLQTYFGVSDRVAAGLVRLFKEKLGIADEFSYKTIERGYDPSPVSEILREVFRLTNEQGNAKETTFGVDGTGEPTSSKVNYESVRSEQRKDEREAGAWPSPSPSPRPEPSSSSSSPQRPSTAEEVATRHEFQLTVSSVGVHTKMYAGFRTTGDRSIGEFSFFPSIVSQTRINCPRMEVVLGDSLYANRVACAAVAGYGATPYFLPKSNAIFLSLGVPSWNNMTHEFVADPQRWLQEYHMRSISETSNSMDKAEFPEKIRRRIPHRKDAVSSLRIYVHNIRRYGYMEYLQPELLDPLRD